MVTTASGTERAPGDSVAGLRQTRERRLQSARGGQLRTGVQLDVVEMQFRGNRRAHRELPVNVACSETRRPLVDLGPYHGDVGDRTVSDPALGAVEDPATAVFLRPRFHPAWIGA